MKKESWKILGILLLGILLISLVANLVAAQSIWESISNKLGGGSGWFEGSQLIISRILLIILVILLVYSISSAIPIISKNSLVKWGISIIIGILSFMFVSTEDVRYILINYEALGIMLTTVFPLIILIVFGFKLRTDPNSSGAAFIVNKVLYFGFALYLIARFFTINPGEIENSVLIYVYPLTFLVVLGWAFGEKYLVNWAKKEERKQDISTFKDDLQRQDAKRKLEAASTRSGAGNYKGTVLPE